MNYTVLATSQEDDRTVPSTSGAGRPIGSTGRGYKVLAEGADSEIAGDTSEYTPTRTPTMAEMERDYVANGPQEQVVTPGTISAGNMIEPNEALDYGIDGDIIAGAAGGKALDVLMGAAKVVKSGYRAATNNRVNAYNKSIDDIGEANKKFTKDTDIKSTDAEPFFITEKASRVVSHKTADDIKPPSLSLITEAVGKVSKSTEKVLNKYWNKILAPVSKRSAIKEEAGFLKDLISSGVSRERANSILDAMYAKSTLHSAKKTALNSILKSPSKTGSALGVALGRTDDRDGSVKTFPDGSVARRK